MHRLPAFAETDAAALALSVVDEVADAPTPFIGAQLRGIVGLEIDGLSPEGKLKLSQNRAATDREGGRAGLMAEGVPLARLMPDPAK